MASIGAWIKDEAERAVEPLKSEIKDLKAAIEELKHELATRDTVIEELKHELAELKVQQAQASAQVPAQAQLQAHASAQPLAQAEAQAQVQAQTEEQLAEQKAHIVKWRRRGCEIQGLEVDPSRAPPSRLKAVFRYNCFDSNCSFKNRDLALDSYIKHLIDRHHKVIRDVRMTEDERNRYLPVRAD